MLPGFALLLAMLAALGSVSFDGPDRDETEDAASPDDAPDQPDLIAGDDADPDDTDPDPDDTDPVSI